MQEYIQFFQQNTLLSVAWVAIVVALVVNIVKSASAKYKLISVNELTQAVNKENGTVVDIRTSDEFKKGHITDSVNMKPEDIKSGNLASLENKKATPIIVVCKSGQTAQDSASALVKAGFEKVSVLKNGIAAWNEANLPLVRGKK
ncbi:rhodanese-like domain-containing protein [Vibrio sp.]|uniref:Rhodanese-like domain-containing protein n=1 Tax=Vibrio viridaestus TaxID=2487322 RepID=A0A3N9TBV3_9VIBR|nr:rhodanese-like domain-containing protein [Vibrio viridaestus]MDC0610108.1 rhodanese-like domain-containing protein [Vibrio sp.]RQW61667.1 rhodanese-like domain-containing protein [Vibrio viridaestus]